MQFYDPNGNKLTPLNWLNGYKTSYFIDGPTFEGRYGRRLQSSRLVENQACALLQKNGNLTTDDIKLIMGWKLGVIRHAASKQNNQIIYWNSWDERCEDRYRRSFNASIDALAEAMQKIVEEVEGGNPCYLFDLHRDLSGFGPVYILTILFFVTRGAEPIYDRYACIGAQAIAEGAPPGSQIDYRPVNTWNDYLKYKEMLSPIIKACEGQPQEPPLMFASRDLDRALWVYGHLFLTEKRDTARC